jgi:hypothetical protein
LFEFLFILFRSPEEAQSHQLKLRDLSWIERSFQVIAAMENGYSGELGIVRANQEAHIARFLFDKLFPGARK